MGRESQQKDPVTDRDSRSRDEVFSEAELLPLSGLQHLVFCERQCALIHLEGVWEDNALTALGTLAHERVDESPSESRGDLRIARGVRLRSLALGLTGRADIVEFHRDPNGVAVPGLQERWRIFPVEYKRGRPKPHRADEVQLCAQAMCLEEMLRAVVPRGALFYGTPRRRTDVQLSQDLRELVHHAAQRFHRLMAEGSTPSAVYESKCDACSLIEVCRPKVLGRSVGEFVRRSLVQAQTQGVGWEE
jgi:CRISPR-associated exonuclease Cas4